LDACAAVATLATVAPTGLCADHVMATGETVGLVLSGGGARGAYEIGVLAELLPVLDQRGERPRLIVGTSIGALNAAYLAATAHRCVEQSLSAAVTLWSDIRYRDVLRRLTSPLPGFLAAMLGQALGLRVAPRMLLDPTPGTRFISKAVCFDQLNENVDDGVVRAALVTTRAFTSESVVFHAGGTSPPCDPKRGISYVKTGLRAEHVRASFAIPGAFPAVALDDPGGGARWYYDGGVRLNTPIKPALSLGADRIVVVGVNSIALGGGSGLAGQRPDVFHGFSQIMQSVLADALANDVRTLAKENRMVIEAEHGGVSLTGKCVLPYAFVAPTEPDSIGRIAQDVYNTSHRSWKALLRRDDLAVLGRLMGAGRDPLHGDLLSYLFFAPEFTRELIALGRCDAKRWVRARHDDGPWRVTSDPP
jgi:NTE family protein